MKEWHCIQLDHHEKIGPTIERFGKEGWRLHTYSVAGIEYHLVNHYLLFERGE